MIAVLGVAVLAGASPAAAQIEQAPLAGLDLLSSGAGETGLPPVTWKGGSAALAKDIFARLGSKPLSPAARSTALALLRTGAQAPEGAGSDVELAAARASALLALGDARGTAAILARTPGVGASTALSRPAAEAALYLGEDETACATGAGLRDDRDGAFWVRLRAYCDAIGGRAAQAELALRLLEGDRASDATFARLLSALLIGEGADAGAPSLRTGLHAALSGRLALDVGSALADATPAAMQALALDGDAPTEVRSAAAGRAGTLGLITTAEANAAGGASAPEAAPIVGVLAEAIDAALPTVVRGRLGPEALGPVLVIAEAEGPERTRARHAVLLLAAAGAPIPDAAAPSVMRYEAGSADAAGARRLTLDLASDGSARAQAILVALDIALGAGEAGPKLADRIEIVRALREAGLPQWRLWAVEGLEQLRAAPTR